MNISFFNSLCYTASWFWCVLWGIHGYAILSVIGAVFFIFLQLYATKLQNLNFYVQDLILVGFSIPLGLFLEMFLIQAGLIRYIGDPKILPPIWILCLYPLFSLIWNHSIKFIQSSYPRAFCLGFFGAPLSYMAGSSLGGLTFPFPMLWTWVFLGLSWGLFLCLFLKVARSVKKAVAETFQDRESTLRVELLYDGECPICHKEICYLRKRQHSENVKFTDIASQEFLAAGNSKIDYETAMQQMHAIDGNGNLITGLAAFAAVYARCDLLVLSTLLRIPILKIFLDPFYRLFAKNRLWITGRASENYKR